MTEIAIYKPSDVQQEAHDFQMEGVTEILYGGTAGCGKTLFLRTDPIITQLYDHWGLPGEHTRWLEAKRAGHAFKSRAWALHVRENFSQLTQTIEWVKDFSKKVDPGAVWKAKENMVEFSCGMKYQFGHLEHVDSWRQYDTQEYTHVSMDEAINLHSEQFDGLRGRIRTPDPILAKKLRICLASNPDAPATGKWVKERFVDPDPDGRKILTETFVRFDGTTGARHRMYFPAYLSDNPDENFRRQYEDTLRTMPRHIMEARLFCNWNVVEGAFFAHEWIPSVHVVEPFKIPSWYPVFRVMDWGYKAPCPVYWVAVNPDGDLIFFREATFNYKVAPGKRKDSQLVALAIRAIEKQMGYWDDARKCSKLTGPADPQISEQRDGGWTIEDRMAVEGVCWTKATRNRLTGTAEVVRRLKDIPSSKDAMPGLVVFNTCKELIRTIPLLPTSKSDPEVPEDGGEDHWYDCMMYACQYRSASAKKKSAPMVDECDRNDIDDARARRGGRRWGYGL